MSGGECQPAPTAMADIDLLQSGLAGYSPQVYFQQSRQVGRVAAFLKSIESVLPQKCHLAQQAKLVRGCDHHQTTWLCQADQLSHKSPRILQVLDDLNRRDHIC